MQFHIENMTCGGCVRGVTATIRSIDPDAAVSGNPETRLVEVTTLAPRERLVEALIEAGFPPV